MAVLGLREAALVAGVNRQTIYRYAKAGKLSTVTRDDGSKGVDTSELVRVFGELRDTETAADTRNRVPHVAAGDRALQGELEATREALRLAQEALAAERARAAEAAAARATETAAAADRERWLREQIDHQRLLLEHQPNPAPLGQPIDPEAIEGASKKKLRKLLRRLLGA